MTLEEYLGHLDRAAGLFADAVRTGPLDASVTSCPAWDLRRLTAHMGVVHRWANAAVATAQRPHDSAFIPDPDLDTTALAVWLRDGADELIATLAAVVPDAPTWHPFPVARVAGVWPRRQAHETTIHRWDAEQAVGRDPSVIPAELAADGVDEFLELVLPRVIVREQVDTLPVGTLGICCVDTGDRWSVGSDDGMLVVRRTMPEDPAGDATLSGSATGVLGALWRRPIDPSAVMTTGDSDVAAAWLALPGL